MVGLPWFGSRRELPGCDASENPQDLLASLLMSLLYLGGESAQMELGLPSAVTGVFQGVLLFFLLAADLFINFRVRVVARAPSPVGGLVAPWKQ